MIIARYTQYPAENKNYLLDYTSWLDTGETIISAVATVSLVTVPPLAVLGTVTATLDGVSVNISGGLEDNDYIVKVEATTSTGQVKEDCLEINMESSCG